MFIADAHLDLAWNASRGREVELPARRQTPDAEEIPTVGLPDLIAGGVRFVCATIYCEPASEKFPGYRNSDEAHAAALAQIAWYRKQQAAGRLAFVPGVNPEGFKNNDPVLHAWLLMECADPIRNPDDVEWLVEAGIKIIGLAWKGGRYAGGNVSLGPITAEGVALVKNLDRLGIIHDASHLSEKSFWQLLEISDGPVIASHSNCRSIVPGERQISDEMIRAIIARGGVIGINFFDKFLLPPDEHGKRRATLADVVGHMRHICELAGNARHAGLGTDMDGGLGRQHIPVEIETAADLPRVADALAAAKFGDADIGRIMGGNWVEFFGRWGKSGLKPID